MITGNSNDEAIKLLKKILIGLKIMKHYKKISRAML